MFCNISFPQDFCVVTKVDGAAIAIPKPDLCWELQVRVEQLKSGFTIVSALPFAKMNLILFIYLFVICSYFI